MSHVCPMSLLPTCIAYFLHFVRPMQSWSARWPWKNKCRSQNNCSISPMAVFVVWWWIHPGCPILYSFRSCSLSCPWTRKVLFSFIFLLKPSQTLSNPNSTNRSPGVPGQPTGKGPVQMHKERAGRQNLMEPDSTIFSLDMFRQKSQHYPKGLVIWGASFLGFPTWNTPGVGF